MDLLYGSVSISYNDFTDSFFLNKNTNEAYTIIWEFRFPKAVTAVLSGAALAVSGLQMQTVFRNPLAGPYILGISAGASLGVAVLLLGVSAFLPHFMEISQTWAVILAAWVGSSAVLLLILLVSLRIRDVMTILIFGIMFGSAISALINLLQYFGTQSALKSYVIWTMGSLSGVTFSQLPVFVALVFVGLLGAFLFSKPLNVLLLGEDYARTLGVNIKTTRLSIFLITSILTGSVTAFCGPIGFVGLVVPHLARLLFQTSNHFWLTAGSILLGALLMLLSDLLSQLPGSEQIIPINTVTSLFGIPLVIWIVLKNRQFTSVS